MKVLQLLLVVVGLLVGSFSIAVGLDLIWVEASTLYTVASGGTLFVGYFGWKATGTKSRYSHYY